MLSKQNRLAQRAALVMLAVGATWIFFSHRLLATMARDAASLMRLERYNGWIVVVLSAAVVFALIRGHLRTSERRIDALAESEDRYRGIFEHSLDGILYSRPDGSVTSANPAACRILGRTAEEICGLGRLGGLLDADNPNLAEALETRTRTGEWSGHLALVRGDGTRLLAEVSTAIFTDHQGEPRATVIFRDESARLAAVESLRAAEEAERALIECSPVALFSFDFDGRVLSWNPAAQRIFGWSSTEVMGQLVRLIPADRERESRQLLSRMRGGEFFTAREIVRQRRDGSLFDASLSTAPIKDARGQTVAIMAAVEDITERKNTERALRANEERYRSIFENHGAPMLLVRPSDGRILDVNPAAAQFYGWSREWLCSMNIGDINSLSSEQLAAEMALARTQRRNAFRFLHLLADGTQRWVEVYSSPVTVDGETLLYSIIHDVSRLQAAEVALARSERLHALLSRATHLIMRATDRDKLAQDVCELAVATGGFLYVWISRARPDGSLRSVAQAGDDRGLMAEIAHLKLDGADEAFRPAQRAFSTGNRVVVNDMGQLGASVLRTIVNRRGIGSAVSYPLRERQKFAGTLTLWSAEPQFFTETELRALDVVASDLEFGLDLLAQGDERRMLGEELQKAERRWRFALEGSGQAVMEWDLVTNATYFSPAWYQMLGHDVGDAPSTADEWFLRVHPEEIAVIRKSLENHLAGQEPTYEVEHRVRHRDGSYRWVLCRAAVASRAADGKPLTLIATHTDVTQRHLAEDRLVLKARRSKALLALPSEADDLPEAGFMQRAAQLAQELTGSSASFIHFVNPDAETIELVTWSSRTLDESIRAEADRHYPLSQAGAWADAVRTRLPVVLNDAAAYLGKRDLRDGHAELRRFLGVPVLERGRVTMLFGVGDKSEPYDGDDIESVQLIANEVWRSVQHGRDVETMRADQARMHRVLDVTPDLVFVDRDERVLSVNPTGLMLLRATSGQVVGRAVVDLFPAESHQVMRRRIAALRASPGLSMPPVRDRILACDGTIFVADVSAVSYLSDGFVDVQVSVRPLRLDPDIRT